MGGARGSNNRVLAPTPNPPVAHLGPFGASLAASKAPLGSNLAPHSPPSSVNLPLIAPTCTLKSQLSVKSYPNLPSKTIFHRICDPPNLDFCNTFHGFSWFFNISTNRFKDASQAPKYLQNSSQTYQITSKMLPRRSQEAPKILPRPSQEAPRALQEAPRSSWEPPISSK